MRWVILFILVLFIGIVMQMYPMVMKEKGCFDTAQAKITDIQYNIVAKNLSREDVCSQRSLTLLDLGDCITVATSGSTLAPYVNGVIESTVYIIRPLTKSFITQKNEHNLDCRDYKKLQLE